MKKSIVLVLCLVMVIAAVSLAFAACNSATVTVTYMDGDTVLHTDKVTVGETFTLYTPPAKANAKFINWYIDKDLKTAYVEDKLMAEITLYAKYVANELSVVIRPNGGTIADADKVVSVTPEQAYTLPVPTRAGYTFAGYTYENAAGEDVAFPTTGVYNLTESIRVTAQWTADAYTVTFKDGETVLYTVTDVGYGAKVPYTTSKAGYTFNGWTDDKGNTYAANVSSFEITSDVVFSAAFTANTYTVNFNVAGGTAIAPLTVTYDAAYTLPAAEKAGYTFVAYTLDGVEFASAGVYTKAGNITVTATYTQNTVTVTFVDAAAEARTATIAQNAKASAPVATAKTGYSFVRWAIEEDGAEAYDFDKVVAADLTLYAVYAPNQYTITVQNMPSANVTVAYGAAYQLPTENVTYPAWAVADSFGGYIFDDVVFDAEGTYTWTESITVVAVFERDALFEKSVVDVYVGGSHTQFIVDDGNTVKMQLASLDTVKTGYTFKGWSTSQNSYVDFDVDSEVNADITLWAYWDGNAYTLTIMDGDTLKTEMDVCYDGGYYIDLEAAMYQKKGYVLKGLKLGNATFSNHDVYQYDYSVVVFLDYERVYRDVTFYVDAAQYGEVAKVAQYDKTVAPDAPTPAEGYVFKGWSTKQGEYEAYDFNAEVVNDVDLYAFFDAKTVKVIIVRYDLSTQELTATYGVSLVLPTPSRNGFRFDGYVRNDEEFVALTLADYDLVSVTLQEKWVTLNPDADDSGELFVAKDNSRYFKERRSLNENFTYVFLTGYEYDLAGVTAIADADDYMTVEYTETGATINVKQNLGAFTMRVTKIIEDTPVIYDRSVKVVNNVTMLYGDDYTQIWVNNTQSGTDNFLVSRSESDVMAAGVNNFVFDLAITTKVGAGENDYAALSFDKANIDVIASTAGGVVNESLYSVNKMTGAITFDESLAGQTVTVTLAPRYAAATNVRTFKLALNTGVNVYTSADLKTSYGNENVSVINVLRKITAELNADDYQLGYPKGEETLTLNKVSPGTVTMTVDSGVPMNDYSHGVYTRITNNTSDEVRINGNFFSIDGSNLPYIDNRYDHYGKTSKFTVGAGYQVANVQIGIFLYRNATRDNDGDTIARFQGGTVSIDNLYISGNYTKASDALQTIDNSGNDLLKMSAAYLGVVCRGGTVNLDNVTVTKTSIGIFTDGDIDGFTGDPSVPFNADKHAVVINMDNCWVYDSWANDIYGYYLTQFNLTGCELGYTSGGAAIAIDDKPAPYAVAALETEINMDYHTASHIQNWVTGDEAWFRAYGQSATATQLKNGIHGNVTAFGMTDLDSTGTKMNFAIFARSGGSGNGYANSDWAADPQGQPSVKINLIEIPVELVKMAMPDVVTATAAGSGISEDAAAAGIAAQMTTHNIYCYAEGYGAQLYLRHSLPGDTPNDLMLVGIPLYIQGTQPQ